MFAGIPISDAGANGEDKLGGRTALVLIAHGTGGAHGLVMIRISIVCFLGNSGDILTGFNSTYRVQANRWFWSKIKDENLPCHKCPRYLSRKLTRRV